MNISPGDAKVLSFCIFSGLTLLMQVGIVVFAFLAARRYKLKGLWFLATGTIIGLVQGAMFFLISSPFNLVEHDIATKYMHFGSGYLSFAMMIIELIGWSILAFRRDK